MSISMHIMPRGSRELGRLGCELAAAQKLQSVGRLTAGVAHEINASIQLVLSVAESRRY
jgi:hypothetical protein